MLIYLQTIESPEEQSKFETIYFMYRNHMYRIAFGILQNPQDAEDALHSAFLKIVENIKKIDDPKCLKTKGYIVTIVRNIAIDAYRKKQIHPQVEYSDETVTTQVVYNGSNALAGCILKLPPQQRDILILKYHHGYKLTEIAKMLDISYRNALQIEQRAKAKLRTLCQEEGIEW